MKKLLVLVAVLAFVGAVQAADLVVANGDFEGGWYNQGWGPTNDIPVSWNSWDGAPNLQTAYAIAGNGSAGGCALEVLPGNPNGGYSFLWTSAAPTVPANTMITMLVDVIDLTPGGAAGDFAGISIGGSEIKLTGVTGSWQTFSYNWFSGAATSAELKIINSTDQITPKGDFPCVYGFDNVRLVPEPMTMALLGLGGLFLRRRSK